jgi:hypothetical protein
MSDAAPRILAVLDDAAVAAALLDICSALAQLEQRELQVVFVERAAALLAAALPVTQVLAHAAARWAPFGPSDIERGWRAQAARLRELTDAASLPREVRWSMQVIRGAVDDVARSLLGESDLVLVAPSGMPLAAPMPRATARRRTIAAVDDRSADAALALALARKLAGVLPAVLEVRAPQPEWSAADLVVLPRSLALPPSVATRRVPVLLVGARAPR